MKRIYDEINARNQGIKDCWDKRQNLYEDRWAKLAEEFKSRSVVLNAKYGIDVLLNAGLKVSTAGGGMSIEGRGVSLDISYESYMAHDGESKDVFYPKYVSVDLSTSGYGWRRSNRDTAESQFNDFEEYRQSAKNLEVISEWAKTVDFIQLMNNIWTLDKEVHDDLESYNRDEIDANNNVRKELIAKSTDEIMAMISEGDDLVNVLPCKVKNVTNGYGRGRSVPSTVIFDKYTRNGVGFRVIHVFPEEYDIAPVKMTYDTAEVRKCVVNALNHGN